MSEIFNATIGQWEYLLRLLLAVICGGAIGYERSFRQKTAGIKTHVIVTVGAVLMMIVSKYGFFDVIKYDSINVDASRIAANIITGISFIGAGVIFLKGDSVKGLTTSAGLWTSSGIGLAIGAGMYTVGIFATVLVLVLQYLLHRFNLSCENIPVSEINVSCREEAVAKIRTLLSDKNIPIQGIKISKQIDASGKSVTDASFSVRMNEDVSAEELVAGISNITNVYSITVCSNN